MGLHSEAGGVRMDVLVPWTRQAEEGRGGCLTAADELWVVCVLDADLQAVSSLLHAILSQQPPPCQSFLPSRHWELDLSSLFNPLVGVRSEAEDLPVSMCVSTLDDGARSNLLVNLETKAV
ncbi:unnamed protein product [Pleuronectes platessa]|uniref:Uncharacterized protein n=1 Tax=Pleuronectes platessa TaxID=8262 RepID=A0A9N7VB90_PLEPL|nr:unnamed protein product [Pleuronectes platessa]